MIIVTHNIAVAAHMADRIGVMHDGALVEMGILSASYPTLGMNTLASC